jgi:hypothetical protein
MIEDSTRRRLAELARSYREKAREYGMRGDCVLASDYHSKAHGIEEAISVIRQDELAIYVDKINELQRSR